MTSGLAPGYWDTTWIVGKSTDGSAEIGSNMYPSNPINSTPAINNDVATGRRMNSSEMFTRVRR